MKPALGDLNPIRVCSRRFMGLWDMPSGPIYFNLKLWALVLANACQTSGTHLTYFIMQKVPFTPEGVSDLLSQIYALPDPQVQQEAAACAANFRLWMQNNFILEDSQLAFLTQIDDQFIATAASEMQYFISGRLPISLIKEEHQNLKEEDDRGKLIDLGKSKQSSFDSELGFSEMQSLTFTISYSEN